MIEDGVGGSNIGDVETILDKNAVVDLLVDQCSKPSRVASSAWKGLCV